jgi:molecular chaperone DnaJ
MTAAALGTKMNVESLDGDIEIEIKAGTQSGHVIPIKGKGMTKLRGGRGDLFAHINVEIPTKLSKRQEELLRQFADDRGDNSKSTQVKKSSEGGIFGKFRDAFKS